MFGINAGLFFILSYFLEIVLFTSLAAAQTGAQPGKFGRMPDGRAYRIDAEGYRIVDRLAELEVTADDLERQVDALENQLADKEKALTRLREGRGEDPAKVIESSLIGVEQDVRGVAPGKTKATEVPNCNELVSNLYRRVAQLERHENNAPSAHVRCDYNSSENPWKREAGELDRLLQEERSIRAKNEAGDLRVSELERRLADAQDSKSNSAGREQQALEQELVSAQEKIAELEKERTNLQKTNGEQQAQLRLMEEERKELRRASLASMPQVERGKNTKDEVFEPVHGPRISQQEVVELKKELQTSLAKLQQTIMQRKDLMDQVNRKNTGVKIQIQPLATGTGISLDQLRQQVSSLSSASDVGAIRGGIGEIQRKLNDDIGVLQRLAKM